MTLYDLMFWYVSMPFGIGSLFYYFLWWARQCEESARRSREQFRRAFERIRGRISG